jgi:hypothetical protein
MVENHVRSNGVASKVAWDHFLINFLSKLGIFAVPIFLFLSGAFFAYAFSQGSLKTNYKIVWKNLKHIAFPYVIWSMIFYLEILILHNEKYSMLQYVKSLIVGYPYHFVPLLIFFYLVSPLLIRSIRYLGWVVIVSIGFYQLTLLNIVYPGILHFTFPSWMSLLAPPIISTTLADWAIFFPLGLIYGIRFTSLTEFISKTKWVLVSLVVLLFALDLLDMLEGSLLPLSHILASAIFILLATTLNRNRIPYIKQLEVLGKNAFILYLINLLLLDILLILIERFIPGVLAFRLILILLMLFLVLKIPLWILKGLGRFHRPAFQRYIFG